jgi:hypothetical protein
MTKRILFGLLGSITGGILAVIGGVLFLRLLLDLNVIRSSGWEDLVYGILAVILLYPLGVGLGGWLALRRTAGRGMWWKALLAAYVGDGLILLLADPLGLNLTTNLLGGLLFLLPPLAVLLAYRLNRPAGQGK